MTPLIFIYVLVYIMHLGLGAGAGYAALRLWSSRHHPLVWRVIVYIHGFIIEAITSLVLLFVSSGTHFTQKFGAVLFTGMFLGDIVRVFLIAYLIKGPRQADLLPQPKLNGVVDADFWQEFRAIVREEVTNALISKERES